MSSATLAVTNATGTAALVVGMSGRGSLTLNNGANVFVNQLLVTNNTATATSSFFSLLNSGNLTTSNAANAVAANIVWTGVRIVRDSVSGLMDAALPASDLTAVRAVIARHEASGVQFHALRTRQSGARRFVSLHVLVPGTWSVHDGHRYLERFEAEVRAVVPNCVVDTHLESLDDPASWDDVSLDRN